MFSSEWRKWFSWYPVQIIGGDWVFLQFVERRFCEDHGGEFTEYRKVQQQIVKEDEVNEEPIGQSALIAVEEYPDGFYWIYTEKDGQKGDVCLVKLYTHPQLQQKGVGFGMWDGAGFMPLTDMGENMHLVSAGFPGGYNEQDQMFIALSSKKPQVE